MNARALSQGRYVVCPNCNSKPRHRALIFKLTELISIKRENKLKVLHFSPEKFIKPILIDNDNLDYLTSNLIPGAAMVTENIENLSFEDNSFDLIICSHVLEHVHDYKKAIKELYRVLRPTGNLILDVPLNKHEKKTFEYSKIKDKSKWPKDYFEWGHLRSFGMDFYDIVRSCGFNVNLIKRYTRLDKNAKNPFGFSGIPICVCRKK